MSRKLTTQEFIAKAQKIHKDTYNYDLVDYKGSATKVKIMCKIHGEFLQRANKHLNGRGCPKCGILYRKNTSKWTTELITKEAQKYKTKKMFRNGSYGAYRAAFRRGIVEEVCSHMEPAYTYHTPESVVEIAKKYTTRSDFRCNCKSAYNYATRKGILDEVCGHMKPIYTHHTHASVGEIAKQHTKRDDFMRNYPGAYKYAARNGILDEVCGHMPTVVSGFNKNKPGILYYLRISGGTAYKIGITNLSVEERYNLKDLEVITPVKQWYYVDGEEAYQQEQKILKTYKYAQYKGDKLLHIGNTELFDRDILLMDV